MNLLRDLVTCVVHGAPRLWWWLRRQHDVYLSDGWLREQTRERRL